MAAAPSYAATILMGSVAVGATADNATPPTHAVLLLTAGASGSKIDELVFEGQAGTAATVAGLITIWLSSDSGSTFHGFDHVVVPAVTPSATVPPWRNSKVYANLVLSSGWTLYVSSTVASQLVSCSAFGGSF